MISRSGGFGSSLRLCLALVLLFAGLSAHAATTQFRVLLDVDNDPGTGCSVATPDGSFGGVEQILLTTVDSAGTSASVSSVERLDCVDPGTSSFGAPVSVSAGGWPVGIGNGQSGLNVIETQMPVSSIAGHAFFVRTAVLASDSTGDDAMGVTSPFLVQLGSNIAVPTLSRIALALLSLLFALAALAMLRRHRSLLTVALALGLLAGSVGTAWAACVLDGQIGDWAGIAPRGQDPQGDGPVGADLGAFFAQTSGGNICFRIDSTVAFNQPPVADPQSVTTLQDTPVAITLTGSDPDLNPITVSLVAGSGPNNGTLTGTPPNVTYTPNAFYAGADSFDFQVTDSLGASDTATVSITVTDVNDPPTVNPATFSIPEHSANATSVGTPVTYTDPDGGQNHSFSITAGNTSGAFAINAGSGQITVANTAALDFATNPSFALTVQVTDDGTPVQSGSATVTINLTDVNDPPVVTPATFSVAENSANATPVGTPVAYTDPDTGQTHTYAITAGNTNGAFAINATSGQITVANSAVLDFETNPSFALTVQVADNGTPSLNGSATITINLTNANDPPVVTPATFSIAENSPNTTTVGTPIAYTDQDSTQNHSFSITAGNTGGAFAINASSGQITVANSAVLDFETNPTFALTVQVTDDGTPPLSGSATVTINLTNVNEPPVVTPATLSVLEHSPASTVVGTASATDPDAGQTLSYAITGGNAGGAFAIAAASGQITVANTSALDAILQGGSPSAALTVQATDNGTPAQSGSGTITVNITDVNDPPSFSPGGTVTAAEGSGPYSGAWATAVSPGPSNESGQTVSFIVTPVSADSTLTFSATPAIDGSGNLSFTSAAGAFGTASFSVVAMDDGGTANGGVDTSSPPQTLTITVSGVNNPPTVPTPPSIPGVVSNISVNVSASGGLLVGATDDPLEVAAGSVLTVGNGSNPAPTTTVNGGSLSINTSTGAFSYNPPAGFSGNDTFSYVVCDNGVGETPANPKCSAAVTATISVGGNTVWFIDAAASGGGDGRLSTPFASLAEFNAKQAGSGVDSPAAGDAIFVASGSYSGTVTLKSGQILFGQSTAPHAGDSFTDFDSFAGISPPGGPAVTAAARPALGGTAPTLAAASGNVINVAASGGNTIRGLAIGNTPGGSAIAGNFGGTLDIDQVAISGTGGTLLLDGGGSGTLLATLGDLASDSAPGDALRVRNTSNSAFDASSTTITSPGAFGIDLDANAGTSSFALGTLSDISTSAAPAIYVAGGSVSIANPGVPSLSSTGAPALDVRNTTLSGFSFAGISSAGSAGNGVNIDSVSGSVTAAGGSITAAAGIGVRINGGASDVTYPGSISNAGRAVSITGRNGGTVSLAGVITNTGTGILVNGNSGGMSVFSASGSSLNTGANAALTLSGNSGHAMHFIGGGLAVSTTSGNGIAATGGGTLTIEGSGNSVQSSTGVAVDIDGVTIGAAGVTLRSVSAGTTGTGPASGIVLADTGSSGLFSVTGDGGNARNGSGGTIQHTTSDGIALSNAHGVVLRQMELLFNGNSANPADITNLANDHAIQASASGDITLSAVHIRHPIGSGFEAFDLTGSNRIDTGSLIEELDQTSNFAGIRVTNAGVSFTSMTIDGSTVDLKDLTPATPAVNGNAMVVLSTTGIVNGAWNVNNSTFLGARGQAMTLAIGNGPGSGGTITSDVTGSTFTASHPINGQNNVSGTVTGGATLRPSFSSNNLKDIGRGLSLSGQIILQKGSTSVLDASVSGNTISNIPQQRGLDTLALTDSSSGLVDAEVFNNTVDGTGKAAVYSSTRGGESDMDLRVDNNSIGQTVAVGSQSQASGIFVDVQGSSSLDSQVLNNSVRAATENIGACGGADCGVITVNVENYPSGSAVANATIEGNTVTGTASPGSLARAVLARARDCGMTLHVDVGGGTGDGAPNNANSLTNGYYVLDDSFSCTPLPTVQVESLSTVSSDNNPTGSVTTSGVTNFAGDVPLPNF